MLLLLGDGDGEWTRCALALLPAADARATPDIEPHGPRLLLAPETEAAPPAQNDDWASVPPPPPPPLVGPAALDEPPTECALGTALRPVRADCSSAWLNSERSGGGGIREALSRAPSSYFCSWEGARRGVTWG